MRLALALGGIVGFLVYGAGLPIVTSSFVFGLLAVASYLALTIAADAIAYWRGHHWRWRWRRSNDEGPFWPGTRIPRGPRPRRPRG